MIFNCRNCGGNMVYSPEKKAMFCPYCESTDSHSCKEDYGNILCPSCGGELRLEKFDSTTQCPYCDSYIILDQQVSGEYLPKYMIPFQMGKEACKQSMRAKFKRHTFAPVDFLAEVRLNGMRGMYVPFWFYNYKTEEHFQGEGTKVRSWTSGDIRYTETSYYNVVRDLHIDFVKIPADASLRMPDDVMDLMAPYDYEQLEDFKPEYLSGFFAECYNMSSDLIESRARQRMENSAKDVLRSTCSGYSHLKTQQQTVETQEHWADFGLLPVWKYDYRYKEQNYPFYINGQNGKIVGTVPLSKTKVFVYSATLWALLLISMGLVVSIAMLL